MVELFRTDKFKSTRGVGHICCIDYSGRVWLEFICNDVVTKAAKVDKTLAAGMNQVDYVARLKMACHKLGIRMLG